MSCGKRLSIASVVGWKIGGQVLDKVVYLHHTCIVLMREASTRLSMTRPHLIAWEGGSQEVGRNGEYVLSSCRTNVGSVLLKLSREYGEENDPSCRIGLVIVQ